MTVSCALARPHTRSDYGGLEFSLVTFFFFNPDVGGISETNKKINVLEPT
jgi:hypothetical protein